MGKDKNKIIYLISFIFILALVFSFYFNRALFYPSSFDIVKGESHTFDFSFPFSLEYKRENKIAQPIFNEGHRILRKSYSLDGRDLGETNIKLKLLGMIPVKNYNVSVVERNHLIPGGKTIGVSLNTKGVLVVAITDVIDEQGNRVSPAKEAGLRVGDNIVGINGSKVLNSDHVVKILNENQDKEIEIKTIRNKKEINIKISPKKSIQDNTYRLGIWIRDKTTGIGTLTYYNLEDKSFGALGHGITDADTGKLLSVDNGIITQARVSEIEQGVKGTPGVLKGVFYKTDEVLGNVFLNNEFGIYGSLNEKNINVKNSQSIPIGFKNEVKLGKAYILTSLNNNEIEKYEIEIIKLQAQETEEQKSMIVKITDKDLLEKTGGIVQGMSGSPIIQNNKIIGAVTHVFINDPTKGYGLYIEWMLAQEDKF